MQLRRVSAGMLIMSALAGPVQAKAPTLSSQGSTVQLTATLDESLSLVAEMQSVGFPLRPLAMVQSDHSIIIQTRWNLDASRARVVVNAYFSEPNSSAATESKGSLPSSDLYVRVTSGTASTFTSFADAANDDRGVELLRQGLTAGVNDRASRTDTLEFRIDLTRESRLPRGDNLGDLTLVATAY